MKSTRVKIFVGLASLCLVAIIAIIAVWAANKTTANTTFTIRYTAATNVKAKVNQSYQINKGATNGLVVGSSTTIGSEMEFLGTEKNDNSENVKSATVDATEINLTYSDGLSLADYVVITITVKNTGSTALYVKPTLPSLTNTNLTATSTYSIDNATAISETTLTSGTKITTGIEANKTMTIVVKYEVADVEQNVGFEGQVISLELTLS